MFRYSPTFVCCSPSLPYYSPPSPSPHAVFLYRNELCVAAAAFYDHLAYTESCQFAAMPCQKPTPQIRHIGCRSAVALLSPITQYTANMPISDINISLTLLNLNNRQRQTHQSMDAAVHCHASCISEFV